MSQMASQQKLFVVFLETPGGGVKTVNIKAASSEVAGKRAMKKNPSAKHVVRVEKAPSR